MEELKEKENTYLIRIKIQAKILKNCNLGNNEFHGDFIYCLCVKYNKSKIKEQ